MKILSIIIISILMSTAYAVDIQIDDDNSRSIDREKSMSKTDTKTQTNSFSESKQSSIKTNLDLSLLLIDELNYSCTNTPKTMKDFGLSYVSNGTIDITKKEFLENAGTNSMFLKDIGMSDKFAKDYISCLLKAGAKLAQASINFSKYANKNMTELDIENTLQKSIKEADNLKDFKIKILYKKAVEQIKKSDCRFYNNIDTIMCGNIALEMSATNSNQVTYLNHHLFGNPSNTYGVSTNYEVSISQSDNEDFSLAKAEENSQKKSTSISQSNSDKKNISIGKFLPGM